LLVTVALEPRADEVPSGKIDGADEQQAEKIRWLSDLMRTTQILTLLLALSTALNIAFATGLTAHQAGARTAQAVLTAAGAASTSLALLFTAVVAYH
jgi:hypothetical protein